MGARPFMSTTPAAMELLSPWSTPSIRAPALGVFDRSCALLRATGQLGAPHRCLRRRPVSPLDSRLSLAPVSPARPYYAPRVHRSNRRILGASVTIRRRGSSGEVPGERQVHCRAGVAQRPQHQVGFSTTPGPLTTWPGGADAGQGVDACVGPECSNSCSAKNHCNSGTLCGTSANNRTRSRVHRRAVFVPPARVHSLHHSFRGYRFDRIVDCPEPDPQAVASLDRLAMSDSKSLKIPEEVRAKLELLLRRVGQKRDLENMGKFIMAKLTARTSVEVPRCLPSQILRSASCEASTTRTGSRGDTGNSSAVAQEAAVQSTAQEALRQQEALALAEDHRHRLFRKFMGSHSPLSAAAYTAHRYAGVYASMVRILNEIKLRAPDFKPQRVMELQAGFAAGLLAAHKLWGSGDENRPVSRAPVCPNERPSAGQLKFLLAIERSTHLGNIGKYLTAELAPPVQWQMGLYEEGSSVSRRDGPACKDGQGSGMDLVIMPHCLLSSVDGQESRHMLVRNMWNRLNHGGILVLVERGTPTGFRVIHAVRELFISELGVGKFHFLAPCPHESICPVALTGRDWCHFAQRVHRLPHHLYCKGSRAKNVEEEKYSYLVVRKMEGPRNKYSTERDCQTPEERSHFWPRIVMPVIRAGQHCLIDLCAHPHTFERVAVSKSMPHAAGYKLARKAAWGDLWRFPRRVVRPEARGYTDEETRQHLLRLASKARTNSLSGQDVRGQTGSGVERQRLEADFLRFFGS
ncbi:mitochondrial small ribosomal subunit rsm22 protein [Cystoisospora suis]|uniref:Mitochondrial small ribosomal subunit rsm22 protein n=1 Tax=Cystoisospora suis TaxID=483139 RepID=A0A2C6L380_9APIC|nr:mitochondrial small ribosomal subunit rsm22 protein [Cystoisospora suis]